MRSRRCRSRFSQSCCAFWRIATRADSAAARRFISTFACLPQPIARSPPRFAMEFSAKHNMPVEGVTDASRVLLEAYSWPGNVRELRNVIERAVIVARNGWIEPRHLSPHIQAIKAGGPATIQVPAGMTLADAERLLILNTLDRTGQNKAEAARQLGLDVKTIRNRLRSYGLDK